MDQLLDNLKVSSLKTQLIEISMDNIHIKERDNDESRRELISKYIKTLIDHIADAKKEKVRTKNGIGYHIDYESIFGYPFGILFCKFNDDVNGYWINEERLMYINIDGYDVKSFNDLFNHYYSTIFHELVHRFDYARYAINYQPSFTGKSINNSPEFEAYYQTYAKSIDRISSACKTLSDFHNKIGHNPGELIAKFWDNAPAELASDIKDSQKWTNKWNKRLFQLFHEKTKRFIKPLKESTKRLS
jgi:hypothetical protein